MFFADVQRPLVDVEKRGKVESQVDTVGQCEKRINRTMFEKEAK